MTNQEKKGIARGTWLLVAGCCLFVVLLVAFAWQSDVQSQKSDEANEHFAIAGLIESAQADGETSGELLQQYVATGDETILPEMQTATESGVTKLTNAISLAGEDPNGFVERGSGFVQSAGEVIALRQSGETQAAVTALTELALSFDEFLAEQNEFVASQQSAGQSAQNSADNAETAAIWIMVSAIVVGIAVVGGAAFGIRRRIAENRAVGTASG